MNIDTLKQKYPSFFSSNPDISIEAGWLPILEQACILLEEYKKIDPNIRFFQIKEKFAEIRIYVDTENLDKEQFEQFHNRLQDICDESRKMCEICGSRENVKTRPGPWIKTYCEACDGK